MESEEAREYVRTAGCECQGTTRKALDIVLSDSEKLEYIKQIVNAWNNDASHSFSDMCKINGIIKQGKK